MLSLKRVETTVFYSISSGSFLLVKPFEDKKQIDCSNSQKKQTKPTSINACEFLCLTKQIVGLINEDFKPDLHKSLASNCTQHLQSVQFRDSIMNDSICSMLHVHHHEACVVLV